MKYPINVFPKPVRRYIEEAATAIQVDPAGVGLTILVGAASQIGTSCILEIKNSDKRPCSINGGIIAYSGERKTAMISVPLKPLEALQETHFRIHECQMDQWKHDCRDAKRNQEMFPEEPQAERLIVSDITLEAVAPILKRNPRGLLLQVDELAAHFERMNSYKGGKGGDEAHWLSMHENRPMVIDRKQSKHAIFVPRANISVIGGIQPAVFEKTFKDHLTENGMMARFLWCKPERIERGWTDAIISEKAHGDMQDLFDVLRKELPLREGEEPFPLAFNEASFALWRHYVDWHGKELYKLSPGPEHALFSKSEGNASRIAIVIHQMRYCCGETDEFYVDEKDLNAGIELAAYYHDQARSLVKSPNQQFCAMIQANDCRITPRDLVAKNKRRYPTSAKAEEKLRELERMSPPLLENKYSDVPARGATGRYWVLTQAGFAMAGNLQQVFQNPGENNKFAANGSSGHQEIETLDEPF